MKLYSDVIKRVPLFKSLEEDATVAICTALRPLFAPAGELIFREGEIATAIYFIMEGTCRVSVRGITLGHLKSGGFFGEMAILDDSPIQNRTVWSQVDSQLRYLEVKDLDIEDKHLAIIRGTLESYIRKRNKADSKKMNQIVLPEFEFGGGGKTFQEGVPQCCPPSPAKGLPVTPLSEEHHHHDHHAAHDFPDNGGRFVSKTDLERLTAVQTSGMRKLLEQQSLQDQNMKRLQSDVDKIIKALAIRS